MEEAIAEREVRREKQRLIRVENRKAADSFRAAQMAKIPPHSNAPKPNLNHQTISHQRAKQ
ncbi:hypothetical protein PanWU01x14_306950 [Parasponia andersonii]|uniref:Uncharacterized protein n=1 Tax=Parasponia andersonii TaxID=3476 RepID=A0A2P5ARM2_PARAD|nr:hypothetical protein PanWU01x14_306950 [Parasponia andersonii]